MYTLAKYVAKTENGFTVERQYEFDMSKKKLGDSVPGTTVVYDGDGHDIGRGEGFWNVMRVDMGDYIEEAAVLFAEGEDIYDVPSGAEEAEDAGYFELRGVDTVEISDGDIRVFSPTII